MVRSREIFDSYIMKELLACSHVRVVWGVNSCWPPSPSNVGLEGKQEPCIGFTATSVLSSPFQRMPQSMSRATW